MSTTISLPHGWKHLRTEADFAGALQESDTRPVVIFKHSTTCGISNHKFFELQEDWNANSDEIALYYLDLLAYRPISNLVAEQMRVIHQSPQMLVIKNRGVVANASHAYATFDFVKKSLEKA